LGLVVAQRVEEVFVREGLIWELRLGGQVIRTTAEHPFYHETRGWQACHHLHVGDKLLCEDGSFIVLEGIRDTGDWETVYNLRIANFHTYFVGRDEWGFAVWAHNRYDIDEFGNVIGDDALNAARQRLVQDRLQHHLEVSPEQARILAEIGGLPGVNGSSLYEAAAGNRLFRHGGSAVGRDPVYEGYLNDFQAQARQSGAANIVRQMRHDALLEGDGTAVLGLTRKILEIEGEASRLPQMNTLTTARGAIAAQGVRGDRSRYAALNRLIADYRADSEFARAATVRRAATATNNAQLLAEAQAIESRAIQNLRVASERTTLTLPEVP
jgi:hypothetical protein